MHTSSVSAETQGNPSSCPASKPTAHTHGSDACGATSQSSTGRPGRDGRAEHLGTVVSPLSMKITQRTHCDVT
jgi:hypothetical protein